MPEVDWIAIGSVAAIVTAAFTAAMAVAVILTAVYARRTLAASAADSRARTRPVLAAYLERELLAKGVIVLVIKNFGRSVATDVRVTFDPPAPDPFALDAMQRSDVAKWLFQRFAEPVPSWAPGWSTSNVVRFADKPLELKAVALSYSGPDGSRYDDRFILHPEHVLKETSSTPSETDDPVKLAQQGVAAMQALVRAVRTR